MLLFVYIFGLLRTLWYIFPLRYGSAPVFWSLSCDDGLDISGIEFMRGQQHIHLEIEFHIFCSKRQHGTARL